MHNTRNNFALLAFFFSSVIHLSLAAVTAKPWTFLVYLAAANSLSQFSDVDLAEMIKVGSNNNVNVIVYLTVFNSDGSKSTKRLYVEKGKLVQIGETTVEDSGDVHTLMKALEWMCISYPAEHYCVDLWNHGGGCLNRNGQSLLRGICYDDDTGHYLTDHNCLTAFSWAKNTLNHGKNIDVVATDACLMSMLEFAYPLRSCVDYLVGSETTIPGDGYEYARILNAFVRGVPSPRSFSQTLVQVYQQTYANTPDYALSVIDESRLALLATNINQVAALLLDALQSSSADLVRKYITATCTSVPHFSDSAYIDMLSFYKKLASYIPVMRLPAQTATRLQQLLEQGETLIRTSVIANVMSNSYNGIGGISFYFPTQGIDPSYYTLCWTQSNSTLLNLFERYIGTE